jgi:DNA-binding CsgD family transcriptional regulator
MAGHPRPRVSTLASTTAHSRDALIERAHGAEGVRDVFAVASERLRRLVPFDASVWLATDPDSGLPTAPTRAENMEERIRSVGPDALTRFWEREFLDQDVNLFRELARADVPAAGLHLTTGGRPQRATRFDGVLRQKGFGDELRAVLRVDGAAWASVNLFREKGREPFESADIELIADISGPLAQAVRAKTRPLSPPAAGEPRGPGLMVFGPDGSLASVNDDALAWLEELPIDRWELARIHGGARFGELPLVVMTTMMRARASAEAGERGTSRARMRTSAGRWLVWHASCLRDPGGEIGDTALVIEPAKGSEIAPIIVRAYELTSREQEITQLISHGVGTAEIAERLFLSTHTVRDHVKAIFEKVGVSSRGELIATLFAEHYAPLHFDPANADWVDDET